MNSRGILTKLLGLASNGSDPDPDPGPDPAPSDPSSDSDLDNTIRKIEIIAGTLVGMICVIGTFRWCCRRVRHPEDFRELEETPRNNQRARRR